MLLGAIGDWPLADPSDEVLIQDVAGDPAAGLFVLQRRPPVWDALLHVRLLLDRDVLIEPVDAEAPLVIDRDAPLEIAAEVEAVRPERYTTDGPQLVFFGL